SGSGSYQLNDNAFSSDYIGGGSSGGFNTGSFDWLGGGGSGGTSDINMGSDNLTLSDNIFDYSKNAKMGVANTVKSGNLGDADFLLDGWDNISVEDYTYRMSQLDNMMEGLNDPSQRDSILTRLQGMGIPASVMLQSAL